MRRILQLIALISIIYFARPSKLQAKPKWISNGLHINIELRLDENTEGLDGVVDEWSKACNLWGKHLKINRNILGYGVFRTFSCYVNGSKVSGETKKSNWYLLLDNSKRSFETIVFYSGKGHLPRKKLSTDLLKVTGLSFTEKLENYTLLSSNFALLMTFYLLDHMPIAYVLNKNSIKRRLIGVKDVNFDENVILLGKILEKVRPPEVIRVFRQTFVNKGKYFYQNELVEAKLVYSHLLSEKDDGYGAALEELLDQDKHMFVWDMLRDVNVRSDKYEIFAHNQAGPGKVSDVLLDDLLSIFETGNSSDYFASLSNSLLSAGYIGMRFGFPILKGSIFSGETRFFGLVAEKRGGWLRGFKLHLDIWPTASDFVKEEKLNFSGQRTSFSYKLNIEFNDFMINSIDISPKVGIWTFNIDIPFIEQDNELDIERFSIDQVLNFGIEIGVEHSINSYIMRAWYGFDIAMPNQNSTSMIQSNQAGTDLIFSLPSMTIFGVNFTISGMVFLLYENFSLSTLDESQETISVEYSQLYYGNGMTISW